MEFVIDCMHRGAEIGYVSRFGILGWDVPSIGHRKFHIIMPIATTMPTATQARRPHKNQDASRSSSRVKLIIMQRALEGLYHLGWQHQAFHYAGYPRTDTIVEATALYFSKLRISFPALKRAHLLALPIYNYIKVVKSGSQ